jgi:putative transposase
VKCACIQQHQGEFSITLMCRALGVSRSTYYAMRSRSPSAHCRTDEQLLQEIRAAHGQSRQTYGSPRVHEELKSNGRKHGRKRIARLMRENGLRARQPRRFRTTTDSRHPHPIADNHLDRQFAVAQAEGPDRVWVADITYVPTREGWLYLAIVLDLATRLVVGWAMGKTLERSLPLAALGMALLHRAPRSGLLHHSDRGVQYASAEYRAVLAAHGITASMSRKANCWDNAVAESFFATLERELIDGADWQTRREASAAIFEYIEVWYNRQRRHSSLGYLTPAEFDRQLALKTKAA